MVDRFQAVSLPRHVAIIMDGNGRWAQHRQLPRVAGHRSGVETVREIVKVCGEKGIEVLTLFAFSSENWRRPQREVSLLMELFMTALRQETSDLHKDSVCLRVIGDRSEFSHELQRSIEQAEEATTGNDGLKLVIAANYGGRWDITQAVKTLGREILDGKFVPDDIDSESIRSHLSLMDYPEPDLFIRTGGEQRISNFLLWQLAYTELYFTDCLWPDFGAEQFERALASFASRQRRFGRTSEQVERAHRA